MADHVTDEPSTALHGETSPSGTSCNWSTGAGAAIGLGAHRLAADRQHEPGRATSLALSSVEVDLTPIAEGMGITTVWRGKPIFVRHRTADRDQGSVEDVQAERADRPAVGPGPGEGGP